MESYFQYRRIQKAVRLQLAEVKQDCTCVEYTIGSAHNSRYDHQYQASWAFLADTYFSCKLNDNGEYPEKKSPAEAVTPADLIVVGWDGQNDPLNPANQSVKKKIFMTFLVSLIALAVTAASAIDACGVREYSQYFQISEVVGSLATGESKNFNNTLNSDIMIIFLTFEMSSKVSS